MGRGPKPAKGKAKPAVSRTSPRNEDSKVRDLEKRLATALEQLQTRDRDLAEAREQFAAAHVQVSESHEQQTATAQILQVISSSPTDLEPVMHMVAQNAMRVCGASDAVVYRVEGDTLRRVAHFGVLATNISEAPIDRDSPFGRAVLERRTIHIENIEPLLETEYRGIKDAAIKAGTGTRLAAPMMREGMALGVIMIRRAVVQPFTSEQIALLETFAAQAVIAIENVRLFTETKEALEQQTATSEILRVISSSPTDVQPVFEAIAASAVRLCGAVNGAVFRFDGQLIHIAAYHNISGDQLGPWRRQYPATLESRVVTARAILSRAAVQVEDLTNDPWLADTPVAQAGYRTVLSVPMMRDGLPIGVVNVVRMEVRPFSDNQIALLKTFADQAVIAIENVRLFNETKEALEQQTATAEILRVIGGSPTDVRPVFEAIARSAVTVCEALGCAVFIVEGDMLHVVATHGVRPGRIERFRTEYPMALSAEDDSVETIRTGRIFHLADIEHNPNANARQIEMARLAGYRTRLMVPMVRGDNVLGLIAVTREAPTPFPDRRVELLQTFADQAVIAIENVRLFTETKEALERQTATSEILSVISRSTTDVRPVFEAICQSSVRLFDAYAGALVRFDGQLMDLGAVVSPSAEADERYRRLFPRPLDPQLATGQAILGRTIVHIPDIEHEGFSEHNRTLGRGFGHRRLLVVPLVRDGIAIGALAVTGREPGRYSDRQIALLQTFADQAVIAIENVRLFNELQSSNSELRVALEQQTATSELLKVIGRSTFDLQPVFETLAENAVRLCEGHQAGIFRFDGQALRVVAIRNASPELRAFLERNPIVPGRGSVAGHSALERRTVHVHDVRTDPEYSWGITQIDPIRTVLMIPMLRSGELLGLIGVNRLEVRAFSDNQIALLQTFADQAAIAIENVRLFKELEAANRELTAASQHKSEFLANMSHELRTPLNAIIGFSEVLSEKMFGELNEKQEEYSKDIHASGQHLLSLINDILDLSKIEAGRMELEVTDFHLPTALDSALTLVRERAARRSIALHLSVDERLGQIQGDERKVRQVVLNLLSNAIKFTPEGGQIELRATPQDGLVEVSVSDTGVGIAPDDQEAVFEEFRQVGTADKKVEGTGLGLTLCRKFVELHGGRIWVKSQLGAGSTFTFTIPVRHGE